MCTYHYTADNAPTNQPIEDTAERRNRLPSMYIRQMAEAQILIPSEQVKLLDSVGQGTVDCKLHGCSILCKNLTH